MKNKNLTSYRFAKMMINDDKENPGQIETELIEKNCDINLSCTVKPIEIIK